MAGRLPPRPLTRSNAEASKPGPGSARVPAGPQRPGWGGREGNRHPRPTRASVRSQSPPLARAPAQSDKQPGCQPLTLLCPKSPAPGVRGFGAELSSLLSQEAGLLQDQSSKRDPKAFMGNIKTLPEVPLGLGVGSAQQPGKPGPGESLQPGQGHDQPRAKAGGGAGHWHSLAEPSSPCIRCPGGCFAQCTIGTRPAAQCWGSGSRVGASSCWHGTEPLASLPALNCPRPPLPVLTARSQPWGIAATPPRAPSAPVPGPCLLS